MDNTHPCARKRSFFGVCLLFAIGCHGEGMDSRGPSGMSGSAGGAAGAPATGERTASSSGAAAGVGASGLQPLSIGDSDFVRVDPSLTQRSQLGAAGAPPPIPPPPTFSSEATGSGSAFDFGNNVYGLSDHRLLQFGYGLDKAFGLQIVDVTDPSAPHVEGTLALDDAPISLHVAGDRVIILSNTKQYAGARSDVEYAWGARIVSVDISDRQHPRLLGRASAPGWLRSGVLRRDNAAQLTLYLALNASDPSGAMGPVDQGSPTTAVASFAISRDSGEIVARGQQELPGFREYWLQADASTLIAFGAVEKPLPGQSNASADQINAAVFDISSADADMRPLGQLQVAGADVAGRDALEVRGAVLRVISSGASVYPRDLTPAGAETEHHVETFDLAPGQQLTRIGHCSFQGTMQVDQSVFTPAGALIVGFNSVATGSMPTEVRAISIDERGQCQDIGRPQLQDTPIKMRTVHGGSRLLGVSQNGGQLRVALYNVADLASVTLLAQTLVNQQLERAADLETLDVFEGVAKAMSSDGTLEAGLMLLAPNSLRSLTRTAQLLTFSETTLSSRGEVALDFNDGVMLVDSGTAAVVSGDRLAFWDLQDLQAPELLGSLQTSPAGVLAISSLGDYQLRITTVGNQGTQTQLEVTKGASSHVLGAIGMGYQFDPIGHNGQLLLQVLRPIVSQVPSQNASPAQLPLTIFDLSDPAQPRRRGEVAVDSSEQLFSQFPFGPIQAYAVPTTRWENLGRAESCTTYVTNQSDKTSPTYYWGSRSCLTHASGQKECVGDLLLCDRETNACAPLDEAPAGWRMECKQFAEMRQWSSWTVRPLDLRDPDAPSFLPAIALPESSHIADVIADGNSLYLSWYEPQGSASAPSALVRDYVSVIDFTDSDDIRQGTPIHVPGRILAVAGDSLIAEVSNARNAGITLARLSTNNDQSRIEKLVTLAAGHLQKIQHDSHGNLIVITEPTDERNRALGVEEQVMLYVLDPQDLGVLGSLTVDRGARWLEAVDDRAAFQVPNGSLIVDYRAPSAPFVFSYIPGRAQHYDGQYVYYHYARLDAQTRQHIKP